MTSLASPFQERRFAADGSYPSMPSMHNDDRFAGASDVPDIDMSPFDNSGILGDDVMGTDLDSSVRFSPPHHHHHHHHQGAVAAMQHDLAVSNPETAELGGAEDAISAAAAVAMAAATMAARVPSAEPEELASSDPITELVAGSSPQDTHDRTRDRAHIRKPERDAVKGPDGLYHCTWMSCEDDQRSFSRKCEFNKHMDKHERPYKCVEPGCEKLEGFTYSGGLIRHEREVHAMYGGPKNTVNCPYASCKRHKGKGFSRQENLNEHIRRLHGVQTEVRPVSAGSSSPVQEARVEGDKKMAGRTVYVPILPRPQDQPGQEVQEQQEQGQDGLQPEHQLALPLPLPQHTDGRDDATNQNSRPSSKRSRSPGGDDDEHDSKRRLLQLDRQNWELREMVLELERDKMKMRKTIEELSLQLEKERMAGKRDIQPSQQQPQQVQQLSLPLALPQPLPFPLPQLQPSFPKPPTDAPTNDAESDGQMV